MFGGRCFNGAQLTVFAKIETPKTYLTGKGWRREARNNADGRTRTGTATFTTYRPLGAQPANVSQEVMHRQWFDYSLL
jgi:hypothetical protein